MREVRLIDLQDKELDEVYCFACGFIIKREAEICPKCGVRQQHTKKKNGFAITSLVFGILSFLYSILLYSILGQMIDYSYKYPIIGLFPIFFTLTIFFTLSCVFGGISFAKFRHKLGLTGLILCGASLLFTSVVIVRLLTASSNASINTNAPINTAKTQNSTSIASRASSPTIADQIGQTIQGTIEKEPWKEGLLLVLGLNPRDGAMPPLSPAQQRCKIMYDRWIRECESGACSSQQAIERDMARCVDDLRQEWLAKQSQNR